MQGEWIQAASGTWHLIWDKEVEAVASDRVVTSWCARVFAWDDPRQPGSRMGFEDVLHDECLRKAEEL